MTILVLGSSGLVGRRLTTRLVDEGHDVVACDVTIPEASRRNAVEGVSYVRADMSRLDQMLHVINEYQVTEVALLSYIMGPLMSPEHADILGACEVNVTGVTNVLEAAHLSGVRRVVFLSTVGTYGPPALYGDRPVTEDDILGPASMYGRMKALNESIADRYRALYGLETIKVRPSSILGPGSTIWPSRFIERVAVGEVGLVPYGTRARDNIIAVDDLAVLLSRLLKAESLEPDTYLAAGHNVTMDQLVAAVSKIVPDVRLEHPTPDRRPSYPEMFDNARAVREFGWKITSVEDSVRLHIEGVRREAGLPPLGS